VLGQSIVIALSIVPLQDFNVLRYKPGQHYHSHMDTFDAGFVARMPHAFGQRMATMIMYLSDVQEGGETVFKREGKYGKCYHDVVYS
jgi:prolyl 4-hydroxylase